MFTNRTRMRFRYEDYSTQARIVRIRADNDPMPRDPRKSVQSALSAFYCFYVESEFDKIRIGE
jgi:hypothetical protein